jgi:hypothetical protein
MITTYIEKKKYYEINRVFIVSRKNTEFIIGRMLNLDTWQFNSTRIRKSEFRRRFEVSPLQYSV